MTRLDPFAAYNFSVELDGLTRAGFSECSGLDSSQSAGEYREGTDPYLSPRKLPGLNTYADITLKRGVTTDRALWDWRVQAQKGTVVRHNISITLLDDVGAARVTWNLFDAWPRQWTGPTLSAVADELAFEEIVIAYERIELDSWA